MLCVGNNIAAAQSRCPGRKTRLVYGGLGSGEREVLMLELLPLSLATEMLRPGLYGNHTPGAVSRTLPLHLG